MRPGATLELSPRNTASISGVLLTTECVVTELPEKDKPAAPGGHDGGGMGGMDY